MFAFRWGLRTVSLYKLPSCIWVWFLLIMINTILLKNDDYEPHVAKYLGILFWVCALCRKVNTSSDAELFNHDGRYFISILKRNFPLDTLYNYVITSMPVNTWFFYLFGKSNSDNSYEIWSTNECPFWLSIIVFKGFLKSFFTIHRNLLSLSISISFQSSHPSSASFSSFYS